MISGVFRDEHPRLTITLPGLHGEVEIEFIVDTGFAGDLSLPARLASHVDGELIGSRISSLSTGQRFLCPFYDVMLDWFDQVRQTEVLVLEGAPLLGTVLLREYLIHVEMIEGGEVIVEPL